MIEATCLIESNFILTNIGVIHYSSIYLASSTHGDTLSQHPRKEEIIKLRTESLKKTIDSLGVKGRKKVFGRKGKRNGSYGAPVTEKKRENGRKYGKIGGKIKGDQMRGKTFEEIYGKDRATEIKEKLSKSMNKVQSGNNNNFFGKNHTKETREKLRKKMEGRYGYNKSKPLIINCVEFISLKHASDTLNIPIPTIAYRVKSKNFRNYRYV